LAILSTEVVEGFILYRTIVASPWKSQSEYLDITGE
jgi:hypothetical protein